MIFALYIQMPEYLIEAEWKVSEQNYSGVGIFKWYPRAPF